MNKMFFRIFSISLLAVDVVSIAVLIAIYFISSIKISTMLNVQLVLAVVVLALNFVYVLYLVVTLITNKIKEKKKQ